MHTGDKEEQYGYKTMQQDLTFPQTTSSLQFLTKIKH